MRGMASRHDKNEMKDIHLDVSMSCNERLVNCSRRRSSCLKEIYNRGFTEVRTASNATLPKSHRDNEHSLRGQAGTWGCNTSCKTGISGRDNGGMISAAP
jgi:hypothetical protein